jgi:hypothetical protein
LLLLQDFDKERLGVDHACHRCCCCLLLLLLLLLLAAPPEVVVARLAPATT